MIKLVLLTCIGSTLSGRGVRCSRTLDGIFIECWKRAKQHWLVSAVVALALIVSTVETVLPFVPTTDVNRKAHFRPKIAMFI